MSNIEVKDVVCDYGVYENDELIYIFNDRCNAELVKEILKVDSKGKRYNRKLTVALSCKDLDIVSNAVKVINNNIVKKGYFSDYDKELLSALLGENWKKEYCIGMILL